jgi:hypothetical protein
MIMQNAETSNTGIVQPATASATTEARVSDKADFNKEEEYYKLAASKLEMKRAVIEQLRTSIRKDMATFLIALVVLFLAMVGLGGWSVSRGSSEAFSVGPGRELASDRMVQEGEQRKIGGMSASPTGTAAAAPSFPLSQTVGTTSDAGSVGSAPASLGSAFIWPFAVCWVALCAVAATFLIVRHQTLGRLLLED